MKTAKHLTAMQRRAIEKVRIMDGISEYSEIHAKEFVRWLHGTNRISKTKLFNRHVDKLYMEYMDSL